MGLPPLKRLLDGSRAYQIPLTRRFRGLGVRSGLLIQGPSGWGEFAPFDDYSVHADARWLLATIEAAYGSWPAQLRDRVEVNTIVPAVAPEDAQQLVGESGCRTAKVKVGGADNSLAGDVARVSAVRDALGAAGKLRVDANGSWDVAEAERAVDVLSKFHLEYVEQPCATLAETSQLRGRVSVPIAIDEGLRTSTDPANVVGLSDAADVLIVKAAPLGGIRAAERLAATYALPVVVSSALETSIGLGAGLALAAALPTLTYACGLGSGRLLASDVVADPLIPENGELTVRRPVVDRQRLATVEAQDSAEPWRHRVARAYEVLQGDDLQREAGVKL